MRTPTLTRISFLPALLTGALLLGACGGEDDGNGEADSSAKNQTNESSSNPTTEQSETESSETQSAPDASESATVPTTGGTGTAIVHVGGKRLPIQKVNCLPSSNSEGMTISTESGAKDVLALTYDAFGKFSSLTLSIPGEYSLISSTLAANEENALTGKRTGNNFQVSGSTANQVDFAAGPVKVNIVVSCQP